MSFQPWKVMKARLSATIYGNEKSAKQKRARRWKTSPAETVFVSIDVY